MLRKEFYKLVEQLKDYDFIPYLDSYNELRFKYVDNNDYCPVTAVCMMETGEECELYEYYTAARKLKLRIRDAEVIAHSADGFGSSKSKRVRNKLLKLAGVE